MREYFLRIADVKGFWGVFFPLDITMSTSVMYELIEWGAAIYFGGALGAAYIGAQGDAWDAHNDMALATMIQRTGSSDEIGKTGIGTPA